jgi:hypothetical protein
MLGMPAQAVPPPTLAMKAEEAASWVLIISRVGPSVREALLLADLLGHGHDDAAVGAAPQAAADGQNVDIGHMVVPCP